MKKNSSTAFDHSACTSNARFGPATRSTACRLATRPSVARFHRVSGFTLIELMVTVMIIAIIAAIAIPSYQAYVRRAEASQAVQGAQQIAALLERHKARNFGYQGFNLTTAGVAAPRTYSFDLKDSADTNTNPSLDASGAVGRSWVLKVTTSNVQNYNFLLTSTGIRCKTKTSANIVFKTADKTWTCGTSGSEPW